MSEDPQPEPQAAEPPAAEPAPAEPEAKGPGPFGRLLAWYRGRKRETEARWDLILGEVRRTGTITKVILIHARYSFGYLSAGFLISAPLTIGLRSSEGFSAIAKSVILGAACAIPFVLLIPFSRVDWGRMRLPEFKNLEVALTRYSTYMMLAVLVLFLGVQAFVSQDHFLHWLCDVRVAWVNLILMFFAWVRTKFHTVLFSDFYTLKPGDDLVLSAPELGEEGAEVSPSVAQGDPALADLAAQAAVTETLDEPGSPDSEATTLSP